MPQITATPATVYLHCRNPRCHGSNQEETPGFREETAWTLGENGGDGAFFSMIERSIVEYRVDDEDVLSCRTCGDKREVTGSPRPQYQPLSGHDPMGLIGGGMQFDPNQMNSPADAQVAELQAQVARLTALVEGKLTPEVDE